MPHSSTPVLAHPMDLDTLEKATPVYGQDIWELPVEILLDILVSVSASSQIDYRSLVLVSRRFRNLAKYECLRFVPVRLETTDQIESFRRFILADSAIVAFVRYLWIMDTGHSRLAPTEGVIAACSYVTSLACTSRTLIALCSLPVFQHTRCRHLALMEPDHRWDKILQTPHASILFNQLTHLQLHAGLDPEFPFVHFTNLSRLSFSTRPVKDYMERHLSNLQVLPNLKMIVTTTFWWREEISNVETSAALALDPRLAVFHYRRDWTELDSWVQGVRGGPTLWEQAEHERKAMRIFSNLNARMLPGIHSSLGRPMAI